MLSKALREYDTVSVEPSTDGRSAVLFEKGASRAGIDVRRFPWIRPLSGDYAYNFDRVASLYAGDPTRPEAWSDVIRRVQAQKRHRREIVDVLAAQQARRNAPPEARAAVAQLADPKAVAILTGQQAGAFGGPMAAAEDGHRQLARRIASEHHVPVVPIFWVDAGSDGEIADGARLDVHPRTSRWRPQGAGDLPVARLTLDEASADASGSPLCSPPRPSPNRFYPARPSARRRARAFARFIEAAPRRSLVARIVRS
jgi:hypothetical protein